MEAKESWLPIPVDAAQYDIIRAENLRPKVINSFLAESATIGRQIIYPGNDTVRQTKKCVRAWKKSTESTRWRISSHWLVVPGGSVLLLLGEVTGEVAMICAWSNWQEHILSGERSFHCRDCVLSSWIFVNQNCTLVVFK